jgi:arsenate reductase
MANLNNKIFILSTCTTCKKIVNEIGGQKLSIEDIKTEKITEEQLTQMYVLAGSYEKLFTRKSMKYRSMNLAEKQLTEEDFKGLILQEYTFLKRPVAIVNNQIFIGNAKQTVADLKEAIENA